MSIKHIILGNLIANEEYARKVLPFLKLQYFDNITDRTVFGLINSYVEKYNTIPSIEALAIDLTECKTLSEQQYKDSNALIISLHSSETKELAWLFDKTEEFCKDMALYNALMDSVKLVDKKESEKISLGMIPKMLQDALAVSFDVHIGHDYFDDAEKRFEFYHTKEKKIPFNLRYFNEITQGGLSNKTLNVCLAGTAVGKSMLLCHCAANNLRDNYNVLYITLEMMEEKIAERIDANLMNMIIQDVKELPRAVYKKKIEEVRSVSKGRLVIKEYPTACASASNFRYLLNELKIKRNFIPDIIYIDYLNICSSSRLKNAGVNSYTYVKAIAEELRGLGVEFNVPIFTATQTNRTGFTSSDVELTDTAESFGLPATADLMFALISSEHLEELGQIQVKQLKNRYNDINNYRKFVIGVDRGKMQFYDVSQEEVEKTVMDTTTFGERDKEAGIRFDESSMPLMFDRKKLEGFI